MPEVVTLSTLGKGAAEELFQEQLNRVLANIADVNTEPEQKREIVLKVTIYPTRERNTATVDISVGSKLAEIRGATTTFFMASDSGGHVAVEHNPQQLPLLTHVTITPAPEPAQPKE